MCEKAYKRSRVMYILEALLEYLISLLVAGSFLATLTSKLGISDSLTGIISSFISLGCVFELLSLFVRPRRSKTFVMVFSIINQLLFMLLYVIPFFNFDRHIKIILFIASIFIAYLTYYLVFPRKINWFMSLVDNSSRGRFTANKEIVSLTLGMVFSFVMGTVVDHYRDAGKIYTSFIICAVVIFVLMVFHTLTMLLSVEKKTTHDALSGRTVKSMKSILRDKNVFRITVVFALWNIASYSTISFYGIYQIKELGFSLKFVSLLGIVYAVARVLVSRFWGMYADKKTFAAMIKICFCIAAAAFFINTFTVPENGKVLYTIHYILYAVATGGINNALINMVFDYVPDEKRADSLAINQAISGLCGFLATICVSPLVSFIQKSGNRFFGIPVYAQQLTSLIAALITVATAVYVHFVIIAKTKSNNPS